jgi:two-component system, cell cycle sensor histidine kinase and response regulator CckA
MHPPEQQSCMEPSVLIVDDNPINLKLAGDVLEAAGYRVERAPDAEIALAAVRKAAPALILLDIALPGMDGLTFAQQLKSDEPNAGIKIVAMTAFAMKGDEQKARAMGCDGYLTKPIDTRRLPQQVAAFIAAPAAPSLRRILIVEDVATNRKLLRATLEAEGYEVLEAADGALALEQLEREAVDGIVTDILMPNMDGYRLCYEIRSNKRLCKLPVIVYTNTYTSARDEQVALEMGADGYLRKPAATRVIVDALTAALRTSTLREPDQTDRMPEATALKSYSGRLIAKLEERNEELEQRTEALRKSDRLFRDLVDHIREAFWMSSPDRRELLYVSPAAELIWGRSCESLQEHPDAWFETVHEADRAIFRGAQEVAARDGEYEAEYRILRGDGSVRWVRDRGFPIRDAGGQIQRLAGFTEDVTERKSAQAYAAQLEAQLRNAQKFKALGSLASGIAHDFNNILMAIVGNTSLLSTHLEAEHPLQERVADILEAGQRASELIRQILAFSRPEDSARKPMQLGPIVVEVLKLLRVSITAPIELAVDVQAAVPAVLADASQVHQVVMNLATNALQAMQPRAGQLTVRIDTLLGSAEAARSDSLLRDGRWVRLTIADTGQGIQPGDLEHIFEPFFTTKGTVGGTGLGLSVVYSIVQAHKGAITVTSQPGQGTTFQVYFPAAGDAWR